MERLRGSRCRIDRAGGSKETLMTSSGDTGEPGQCASSSWGLVSGRLDSTELLEALECGDRMLGLGRERFAGVLVISISAVRGGTLL